MELYDTEEQQVEAIKSWWAQYGNALIAGVVIGVGGLIGWHYYQEGQTTKTHDASHQYTEVMQTLTTQGVDASQSVSDFIDNNPVTEYSVLAAMQLAKAYVQAQDFDNALQQLRWAKENNQEEKLEPLLTFDIARIEKEQGDLTKAEQTLNGLTDEAWKGRVAELRGDIALQKGDQQAAYTAYTQAQQEQDASQLLALKLDDLAQ
ncbi:MULTISPECIES: tetratricopeptide repeat protein [unclassified Vibrio]|uniref:Ancillary SecYEG translocon subunit n=1 Tax=Vibrio sp. HB236076 TaxID=3232307 RepID=A0AB39HF01_9VIBR|nr:tetratricopeptide repeat protein [Vibrio sp. HB161653]MDP5254095.1 tetratricopeptide repeat protein [Vibrio sp. HB161653]